MAIGNESTLQKHFEDTATREFSIITILKCATIMLHTFYSLIESNFEKYFEYARTRAQDLLIKNNYHIVLHKLY